MWIREFFDIENEKKRKEKRKLKSNLKQRDVTLRYEELKDILKKKNDWQGKHSFV